MCLLVADTQLTICTIAIIATYHFLISPILMMKMTYDGDDGFIKAWRGKEEEEGYGDLKKLCGF